MSVNLHDARLKDPDFLAGLFEDLGYTNIRKHPSYLSFGRADGSSKSISAYFNQDKTIIHDYPRDIKGDLITFIHEAHDLSIGQTIRLLEHHAGSKLDDYSAPYGDLFGGFFRNRYRDDEEEVQESLDHALLEQYETLPNTRFLEDHISLKAQSYFEIGYDADRDMITIPIYSDAGDLIGVKARANYPIKEGGTKYVFLYPCRQSETLYGCFQNRPYLEQNDVLLFEAEKSVMQAFSYGYRNALAIGSSSLSQKQIELLADLAPAKIILLFDQGLHPKIIEDNLKKLQHDLFLENTPLYFWDSNGFAEKMSPTDQGREVFEKILQERLILYEKEGDVLETLTS